MLLTISATSAYSSNVEYLTFNVSGSPVVIALAEHPVITFTDNTLHIKTAKNTIDIPVNEFSGAVFSETTSIKYLKDPKVQLNEGCVCFHQLPPESKIKVYATNGKEVLSDAVDGNGQVVINLNSLSPNVYIIKSATQTIKVTKE